MAKDKFRLIGDNVAIKVENEKQLASGIVLPDTAKKDKPKEGIVSFVGPGKKDVEMTVKPGDYVFFSGWADPIKVEDNEEYYVVSQDDIKLIKN